MQVLDMLERCETPPNVPLVLCRYIESYHVQVLDMLERGETPPNVRKDINDKPPNPNVAPPAAKLKPRPKPWERVNGHAAQSGEGTAAAPSQAGPTPDSSFRPGSVIYAASGSSFSGRPNALPGSTGYPMSASSSAPTPDEYQLDFNGPIPQTSSSQNGAGNPRTNGSTTDDSAAENSPAEVRGASGMSASQSGAVQVARAGSAGAPAKTGYLGALMKGRAEALRTSPSPHNGLAPDTDVGTGAGSSSEAPQPWVPPAAPTPSLPTRRPSPKAFPTPSTTPTTADVGGALELHGKGSAANGIHMPEGSMYSSSDGAGMSGSEGKSMPHLTHEQEATGSDRMANGITGSKSDVQSYSLEDSFHEGSFSDGASSPTHPLPEGTQEAVGDGQHGNDASQGAAARSEA